jgi:hypothetical protein
MQLLLTRLETGNVLVDNNSSADNDIKRSTAAFTPLAAIVAIGQLLTSPKAEDLNNKELAVLVAMLMKYLAGWLHVDPPMSIISTKFGFVPNRETCKIVPYKEVYTVLMKVLDIIGIQDITDLSCKAVSGSFPYPYLNPSLAYSQFQISIFKSARDDSCVTEA